ncbi:MAG: PGPGW domain-containing protein [Melioribacteraceae bacterium]|nr:PGPGW domain-containing protein [Melioribacteraceae bacterium]
MIIKTIKQFKRLIVAIVGLTILLIGIILIVLPGPAFIIIPLGLSILASEFMWAKKLMDRLKEKLVKVFTKF